MVTSDPPHPCFINPAPATPAGVYIHWPFCERKCPYCDFYTFGREHPWSKRTDSYLGSLLNEIESTPVRFDFPHRSLHADTVYFGGGTPSLMGAPALARILEAINSIFVVHPDAEVTLEVNPTTAEAAGLDQMRAAGVNRLSVGAQSFNDRVLRELGRVHDAVTTRRALRRMRELGFDNLSLDLIFGAPTQTLPEFAHDVDAVLSFNPEHISAYGMTIHEGTPFARRAREGRLPLPPEEDQAEMFEHLLDTLASARYEHYEISNWARPGRRSRHNSKYWQHCAVFGFGAGAHGSFGERRYENKRDLPAFVERSQEALARPADAPGDERARRGEIMMLALRRVDGVSWKELQDWLGADPREIYVSELYRLTRDGLIIADERGLQLSRRGILLADSVMECFF